MKLIRTFIEKLVCFSFYFLLKYCKLARHDKVAHFLIELNVKLMKPIVRCVR